MIEISFYKKLKLLWEYKSLIKKGKKVLNENNFRYDGAYRLYTVINVPIEQIPVEYRMNASDAMKLEQQYVNIELPKHKVLFSTIDLGGLYSEPRLERVKPNAYLVHYEFKHLNSVKYHIARKITFISSSIIGVGLLTYLGFKIF